MRLSAKRIRKAVLQLLRDPRYRDAAVRMQEKLKSLRGLERAVEVIESSLEKESAGSRIRIDMDLLSTGDRYEQINSASASLAPH
jgi:hypothetical protein